MTAQPVPEWLRPEDGFTAADLDRLPGLPDHPELIDSGLAFMSPQRLFHLLVIDLFKEGLRAASPDDVRVRSATTVTLDRRTRVEPDVLLVRAAARAEHRTDRPVPRSTSSWTCRASKPSGL